MCEAGRAAQQHRGVIDDFLTPKDGHSLQSRALDEQAIAGGLDLEPSHVAVGQELAELGRLHLGDALDVSGKRQVPHIASQPRNCNERVCKIDELLNGGEFDFRVEHRRRGIVPGAADEPERRKIARDMRVILLLLPPELFGPDEEVGCAKASAGTEKVKYMKLYLWEQASRAVVRIGAAQ